MIKKRNIEVAITITFVISILLIWFMGFKYFAGFEYATPADQMFLKFLMIVFYSCLFYFIFRFVQWVVQTIKRLFKKSH